MKGALSDVSHGGTVNKVHIGLGYLNSLAPWNGRGGFALQPIKELLSRLGDPQESIPLLHIAGTNGKGSVSASLASILGQSGYRVGLNTSPHLEALNERIVVDGWPVSDELLGELAYDLRSAAHKGGDQISFHEAITALSFLCFREVGVEWGVVEVGLGGRLDASNVISRPAASAIVTIDYDHQHILGNTLAEIAAEKGGIIKPGCPLVSGLLPSEALAVIKRIAREVPHRQFGRDFDVRPLKDKAGRFEYWNKFSLSGSNVSFEFDSPLPGIHQGHNMAVAAAVALEVGLKPEACKQGIETTFWPGRLEQCDVLGRRFVLDAAHNPAGIKAFIAFLNATQARDIDLTFGALDTKNWEQMLTLLRPFVKTWRILVPDSERALPEERIVEFLKVSGNEIRVVRYGADYETCVKDLLADSGAPPAYVTGSMYMLGRLRKMLSLPKRPLWTKL
jgi:dihydrofolate synthase/folylpolyglutamate synthase